MTTNSESKANLHRGKWSEAGIPHKGWGCVGVTDLGPGEDNHTTCEMCESAAIRYVHHMSHPEYPGILDVGCVCAGHMEGNYAAAVGRDRQMRNAAAARQRDAKRQREAAEYRARAEAAAQVERARVEAKAKQLGMPVEDVIAAERFRDSPAWAVSAAGNIWRRMGEANVTVFPVKDGDGWTSLASCGGVKRSGPKCRTQDAAKALAYFAVVKVLEEATHAKAKLMAADPFSDF